MVYPKDEDRMIKVAQDLRVKYGSPRVIVLSTLSHFWFRVILAMILMGFGGGLLAHRIGIDIKGGVSLGIGIVEIAISLWMSFKVHLAHKRRKKEVSDHTYDQMTDMIHHSELFRESAMIIFGTTDVVIGSQVQEVIELYIQRSLQCKLSGQSISREKNIFLQSLTGRVGTKE